MVKILSKKGDYDQELLPQQNGKESRCHTCGEPIRFAKSFTGKAILPVTDNEDGTWTIHFDVCQKNKVAPLNTFDPDIE